MKAIKFFRALLLTYFLTFIILGIIGIADFSLNEWQFHNFNFNNLISYMPTLTRLVSEPLFFWVFVPLAIFLVPAYMKTDFSKGLPRYDGAV